MLLPTLAVRSPPSDGAVFEQLCLEIWRKVWSDPAAGIHGRSGQAQHGVDIVGRPRGSSQLAGIQCKASTGTARKLATEITESILSARDFRPPLERLIVATTFSRDVNIAAAVNSLVHHNVVEFQIELWFWEDIVTLLQERYPEILRSYLLSIGLLTTEARMPLPVDPARYLDRPVHLDALRTKLLGSPRPLVISGLPGSGKTVLAAAVASDPIVKSSFPDGLAWVHLGAAADLSQTLSFVAEKLTDTPSFFPDLATGKASLLELLRDKRFLLVLDDVWSPEQAQALDIVRSPGRIIATTRSLNVAARWNAEEYRLSTSSPDEALALLAHWTATPRAALPSVATELASLCAYLPFALAVVGARVREGTSWEDSAQLLRATELDKLSGELTDYPFKNLRAMLESHATSLPQDQRSHFHDLVVFDAVAEVPRRALEILWSPLPPAECRELARMLTVLNLATWNQDQTLRLHDLWKLYLRQLDPGPDLHRRFVENYRSECSSDFASGPDDGYFYQYLPRHLAAAGMHNELRDLLFEPQWVHNKLRATGPASLLSDYDLIDQSAEVRGLKGALLLAGTVLASDPPALLGQLLGRLDPTLGGRLANLLDGLARRQTRPWLRPVRPSLTRPGESGRLTLRGSRYHRSAMTAISPHRVIVGQVDGNLADCNTKDHEIRYVTTGHTDGVHSIAIQGSTLVSASADASLRIWDLDTLTLQGILRGHQSPVLSVAFVSSDRIVSGCEAGRLCLWTPNRPTPLLQIETGVSPITALTPLNEERVALGYDSGAIEIYNLQTAEAAQSLIGHKGQINDLATTDISTLLSASEDGSICVWSLTEGKCLRRLQGHTGSVTSLAVIPPNRVVSASQDFSARLWDIANGSELDRVDQLAFTPTAASPLSRRRIALHGIDTLQIWDLHAHKCGPEILVEDTWIWDLVIVDVNLVACALSGARITLLSIHDGEEVGELIGHSDQVYRLALLPDGRLSSTSKDGTARLWNLATRECVEVLQGAEKGVTEQALHGDDSLILGGYDGSLQVWDLRERRLLRTFPAHRGMVHSIQVLNDGRVLTLGDDDTLAIWDLSRRRPIRRLRAVTVSSVFVLDPSLWVLGYSREGDSLQLWDSENYAPIRSLAGHTGWITDIKRLSPEYLATASDDQTVRIWRISDWTEIAAFTMDGEVSALAPLPDGRTFLAADSSGRVHLLRLEVPQR